MVSSEDKFYEFQESIFLDTLHEKNVTVFLSSGVKLTGRFDGHDNRSILLNKDSSDQIVYKGCIASISEDRPKSYKGSYNV